jgi:hypothetical protein
MRLWLVGVEQRAGSGYLDARYGLRAFGDPVAANEAARDAALERAELSFLVLEADAAFAGTYRVCAEDAEAGAR